MTDNKLLQQDEVDALLKAAVNGGKTTSEKTGAASPGPTPGPEEPTTASASGDSAETSGDPAPQQAIDINDNVAPAESVKPESGVDVKLDSQEKDALGEIGNISMGSAATTLSQLLNKRVIITSPFVNINNQQEFFSEFNMPFLIIKVKFKEGFDGYNVLIIKMHDAIVMANLMMGGDGTQVPDEISEMEISAAAEAMNQMIGTASTSLADLLSRSINIEPPETALIKETEKMDIKLPFDDPIVVISFRMNIEDLLDTTIMQVIDINTAREQSALLWKKFSEAGEEVESVLQDEDIPELPGDILSDNIVPPPEEVLPAPSSAGNGARPGTESQPGPAGVAGRALPPHIDPDKLNLLLDIPLKVSVVLGRTKKQIRDVLQMTPGAIVELETLVGEPVEILVNGKLVARGEVVVVNENFGVKITSIISAKDRIHTLGADSLN